MGMVKHWNVLPREIESSIPRSAQGRVGWGFDIVEGVLAHGRGDGAR